MKIKKIAVLATFILGISLFIIFDATQYLSLSYIKAQQAQVDIYVSENPLSSASLFFGLYILLATIAMPGITLLTLLAGSLFGFVYGTIIVSFASTIGATLSFLASRYIIRDLVENLFSNRLKAINSHIEKSCPYYLMTLRLIPIIPFFLINIAMGLTNLPTRTFYLVSQAGMLVSTAIYVNAGTQLATIKTLGDILTIEIVISLLLLGLLPLLIKKIIGKLGPKGD